MASLPRRLVSRVRAGVSRRVSPLLVRVGLREARPPATRTAPDLGGVAGPTAPAAPAPGGASAVESVSRHDPAAPLADTAGPMLTREQVAALFEEMVRPALQSDGGDIELVKVEDNDVYVTLVGACGTCPSSVVTMQDGIERLLREEFPHFGRLVRVGA